MIIRDLLIVIAILFMPAPKPGAGPVPDCVDIGAQSPAEGVCETVGVVEISNDWAVKLLIMSDGRKAGITLHNHPEIESGDQIYIKANYYAYDGWLDLADYIEMLPVDRTLPHEAGDTECRIYYTDWQVLSRMRYTEDWLKSHAQRSVSGCDAGDLRELVAVLKSGDSVPYKSADAMDHRLFINASIAGETVNLAADRLVVCDRVREECWANNSAVKLELYRLVSEMATVE